MISIHKLNYFSQNIIDDINFKEDNMDGLLQTLNKNFNICGIYLILGIYIIKYIIGIHLIKYIFIDIRDY